MVTEFTKIKSKVIYLIAYHRYSINNIDNSYTYLSYFENLDFSKNYSSKRKPSQTHCLNLFGQKTTHSVLTIFLVKIAR